MSKKAAIELSVTAIVILILAIVILGLGLGFIRGMFSEVATQFEQQIAAEPEPPTTSGADPLTLSRESIISHSGDTEILKIGAYNPSSEDWLAGETNIGLNCSGVGALSPQTNLRKVGQGESQVFNVLFTIPKNTDEKTYLCYAYVGKNESDPYFTKDFTIKIRR